MDYRKINKKFVRKPYYSPRIGKTMQHLEGFQYADALYLSMGYCAIRLFYASQDMTAVVTKFGKLGYNRLLTGMCASGDILQAKVDKILGETEGIKTYINDILALYREIFYKHIYQLRVIFSRMLVKDLKVNATNFSFGLKDIPYL